MVQSHETEALWHVYHSRDEGSHRQGAAVEVFHSVWQRPFEPVFAPLFRGECRTFVPSGVV
jgi:hypothetical protein